MLVAVTGGVGFIGKRLVLRHLSEGDTVRILSEFPLDSSGLPEGLQVFYGDLVNQPESLIPFVEGADILYHCAGETRNTDRMYDTHVVGTRHLCAAADHRIVHWVQLSSVGVYGPYYCSGTITEDSPLNPYGVYEKTKGESDLLVIDNAGKRGFTYTILRPSNVIAASMANQSVFQMISMIDRGLFFFIGRPGALMNYIHVDNVIEALIKCGKNPVSRNRIYNLTDSRPLENFVAIIAQLLNKPTPKLRLPKFPIWLVAALFGRLPGFPLTMTRVGWMTNRSTYSVERIQRELGYDHMICMEESLKELVQAWKEKN